MRSLRKLGKCCAKDTGPNIIHEVAVLCLVLWQVAVSADPDLVVESPRVHCQACAPQCLLLSRSVAKSCPTLLWPHGLWPVRLLVRGILRARILEWVAIPSLGDLPDSGVGSGSPASQADPLLSEPEGEPSKMPLGRQHSGAEPGWDRWQGSERHRALRKRWTLVSALTWKTLEVMHLPFDCREKMTACET